MRLYIDILTVFAGGMIADIWLGVVGNKRFRAYNKYLHILLLIKLMLFEYELIFLDYEIQILLYIINIANVCVRVGSWSTKLKMASTIEYIVGTYSILV